MLLFKPFLAKEVLGRKDWSSGTLTDSKHWFSNKQGPRDGVFVEAPAEQVVLGDTVKLDQEDMIPADAITSIPSIFEVSETSLIGESKAVIKSVGFVLLPTPAKWRLVKFIEKKSITS